MNYFIIPRCKGKSPGEIVTGIDTQSWQVFVDWREWRLDLILNEIFQNFCNLWRKWTVELFIAIFVKLSVEKLKFIWSLEENHLQ